VPKVSNVLSAVFGYKQAEPNNMALAGVSLQFGEGTNGVTEK
jgi:hypothetical protein